MATTCIRFAWAVPVLLLSLGTIVGGPPPVAPKPASQFQLTSKKPVHCASILPDSKTIVVGGGFFMGPGELMFWDVAQGKAVETCTDHKLAIWSISVSPDSKLLATGGGHGEVKLWDVATRKVIAHLDAGSEYTNSVAFSPDGKLLVNGGDKSVKVWDVKTHKCVADLPGIEENGRHGLTFSPDGKTLAVAEIGGVVRLWDVATWKEKESIKGLFPRLKSGVWGRIGTPVYSPGGTVLAIEGGYFEPVNYSVKMWHMANAKVIGELKGRDKPLRSILSMVFTPDGKHLVTGGLDQRIRVWDIAGGKELISWVAHKSVVRHLSLSRDGKTLVSCGDDEFVRTWDLPAILK